MTQKQFQQLLEDYLTGNVTPQQKKMVEEWYASMDEKELTPGEKVELEAFYLNSALQHIRSNPAKSSGKQLFFSSVWRASIAASLIFILATLGYFLVTQLTEPPTPFSFPVQEQGKFIMNDQKISTTVLLADGSQVTLQPQSKIHFNESFNNRRREVYLEGEAFFEVKRDVNRPFIVYSGEIATQVLGTSFTVSASPENKNVTVAVRTGKVSVYKRDQPTDITEASFLTPNQQIVFDRTQNKMVRTLVEKPQPILTPAEITKLQFDEATVSEVMLALEQIYGVDIVFDATVFSDCALTTSISEAGLYDRLDIICHAIEASYVVAETQIILSGKGCKQ